jgi:hypothetical protein
MQQEYRGLGIAGAGQRSVAPGKAHRGFQKSPAQSLRAGQQVFKRRGCEARPLQRFNSSARTPLDHLALSLAAMC